MAQQHRQRHQQQHEKLQVVAGKTRRCCKAAITSVNCFGPTAAVDQNLDRDLGVRVLNLLLK